MEENNNVVIQNSDNTTMEVEVLTYLFDENKINKYLVYSKGEIVEGSTDEIIYISKIINDEDIIKLTAIDDNEWGNVQNLLKKIANASKE